MLDYVDPRTLCEYRHDTHVVADSVNACVAELMTRQVAFVPTAKVMRVPTDRWDPRTSTDFAFYFFNPAGLEVAHFMCMLASVVPALCIFDTPRRWDPSLFNTHADFDLSGCIECYERLEALSDQ